MVSEGANTMDIGRVSPQQALVVNNYIICMPWDLYFEILVFLVSLDFVKIKVMMGNELPRHRLDAGLCYIFLIIKPH